MSDNWVRITASQLTAGMVTNIPQDQVPDNVLPYLKNVVHKDGNIQIDSGYGVYGQAILVGYPQKIFEFQQNDGVIINILVTTAMFYKWNTLADEWDYVDDGTGTTLGAEEALGQTNLTVVDSSMFSDGDYVGIVLADGSMDKTTIDGAPPDGTHIVITTALTGVASNGNGIIKPAELIGSLSIPPSLATYPAASVGGKVYLANGMNNLKEFDGTTLEDASNLPSAGNCKPRIVKVMDEYLLLLNVSEGGTSYPFRVRNCATGDPTNWTTNNAGYTDLRDADEHIIDACILGPYLMIYRQLSIVRTEYVGTLDTLFTFDTMINDRGAISNGSVISIDNKHYVMDALGCYIYLGGLEIEPIDINIRSHIFGAGGIINYDNISKVSSNYMETVKEVWWAIPTQDNEVPDTILRYDINSKGWYLRNFHDDILGMDTVQDSTSMTWTELSGMWVEQAWRWRSGAAPSSVPLVLLCDHANKRVLTYDYISTDDDGNDIDYIINTKEFNNPDFAGRTDYIDIYIKGTNIVLSYSTDGGETWRTWGTASPGALFTRCRLFKQIVSRSVQWRFSGTGEGFALRWFSFKIQQEGE